MTTEAIAPLRRSVTVRCTPETAFRVFTAGMGRWWPLDVHAIAVDEETGHRAVDVGWEPRAGGEVYEITDDGRRGHWADVVAWEPPHRLVMAWRPNAERAAATEVEIRFTAIDGGTLVELEHRAWQRLGELAHRAREAYGSDTGWVITLQRFAAAADAETAAT